MTNESKNRVQNLDSYFSESERQCQCGCGMDITPAFLAKLNELRRIVNKPMSITSGARCQIHNAKVGGAAKSQHVNGIAVDIKADPAFVYEILLHALPLGFRGIGISAKGFIHIDLRPGTPVVWQYG